MAIWELVGKGGAGKAGEVFMWAPENSWLFIGLRALPRGQRHWAGGFRAAKHAGLAQGGPALQQQGAKGEAQPGVVVMHA